MSPAAPLHDGGAANDTAVFIDTSLDTHLATIVSDSDTVSDLKRKIALQHRQLFPAIGDIKVECLKIKRRGGFYHLVDCMLVKTAFSAVKGNWFVSVDASRLEQSDGIQHVGKRKDGDQLALPWVTHTRSIERHDNHGSPSTHSKIVPCENRKVLIVDQVASGGSCKDVSKNVDEDRPCSDNHLDYEVQEKLDTVNTDINSKKRMHDVHDESSLKDAFESQPSGKKKRKTKRLKSNMTASEENIALTCDKDKVNNKGTSINNEGSIEHKSEGKDLSDENNRVKEDEKFSALVEVASLSAGIFMKEKDSEGVGSETVGDVAMVVENNTQQELSAGMSLKDKDSVVAQKPATEDEIHSSLMRTSDCEHDAAGVTATGLEKHSTKHKAAEKEVFSTQQDVGSNGQECAGDQTEKYKDDLEISLKQKPELKLPGRKKGATGGENIGEGKRRKTKKLFKHPGNLVGDISSTVPASVIDERKMDEVSEKTLEDAKKGDDVVVKEMEVSVENTEEKSKKEFTDTNDVATEENLLPHSESLMNNDAEIPTTGKETSQVNAQGILDNLEKQNEKTGDTTKKKKKRRAKKPTGRNEDESITKHVDGGIFENVKGCESGLPDADRKDGDVSSTVLGAVIDESKVNEAAEEKLIDAKKGDDVIMKEVEISVENLEENSRKEFTDTNDAQISTIGKNINQVHAQGISDNLEKPNETKDDKLKKKKRRKTKKTDEGELESKKSQSVDHYHVPETAVTNVTASEVSKVNNGDDITEDGSHEVNFREYFDPVQPNKIASIDNKKDIKKSKNASRNDRSQKVVSKSETNKISTDVLKDPNITVTDNLKTPKRTKKIDVQKTNKQQSISGQSHVNTVKNKTVNCSQQVKSLLNTPGSIFGDDSDDNASVNSDSSTRSPSRTSSSSSSSSSGYSLRNRSGSLTRKRQDDAGKNNINSESKSKGPPKLNTLLRRSSGFKKAKVTASSQVEDTESQPVDFVPDSQLI